MRHGASMRVPLRRRREGRTDYRRRLNLLRSGKARAVVRKSLKHITIQFADIATPGDRVRAAAMSGELKEYGWTAPTGNLPAAYLTGLLAGKRAAGQGITEAVLDLGRQVPSKGGRLFAALQGILDAGVTVPHSKEVLPPPNRLSGEHLPAGTSAMYQEVKSKLEVL